MENFEVSVVIDASAHRRAPLERADGEHNEG